MPYLIEARVGGRLRTGRVFTMEMLEKCQGCILKCLVCFSRVDSCLLQSCFGGETGGKFKGYGANSGAEAPSLTWKFWGRAATLTPRQSQMVLAGMKSRGWDHSADSEGNTQSPRSVGYFFPGWEENASKSNTEPVRQR